MQSDDWKAFRELLSTGGAGLIYIGELLKEIEIKKTNLLKADMRATDGISEAYGLQQQIVGLNMAIDLFLSLAEKKDDD